MCVMTMIVNIFWAHRFTISSKTLSTNFDENVSIEKKRFLQKKFHQRLSEVFDFLDDQLVPLKEFLDRPDPLEYSDLIV